MPRTTPDSLSRRTRLSVPAGDNPTMRASSTFVRSASSCSSLRSRRSISSSLTAILLNIVQPGALCRLDRTAGVEHCRHAYEPPLHPARPDRVRAALGHHRPAVEGGPDRLGPGLADRRPLHAGGAAARLGGPPPPAPGGVTG